MVPNREKISCVVNIVRSLITIRKINTETLTEEFINSLIAEVVNLPGTPPYTDEELEICLSDLKYRYLIPWKSTVADNIMEV